MSDQWIITTKCRYCGSYRYDLCYPTCVGWNPTGTFKWEAYDLDCNHSPQEEPDEVYSCTNN